MKYVFITLSPGEGNLTLFLKNLARGFKKEGYEPVLLFDRKCIPDELPNDIIAYSWPSFRPTKLADFVFLYRLIKKYRPYLVISAFGAVNVSLLVSTLLRVPKKIMWYHTKSSQLRHDSTRNKFAQWLLRWRKVLVVHLFGRYLITNSKSTAQDAVSYLKLNMKRVLVIDFLLPGKSQEIRENKQNQILCIGRLHPSKGQSRLIAAVPLIIHKYPDVHIVFLGDGPQRATLEKQTHSLSVDANCHFKGSVPLAVVYEELAKSKIHVSVSLDEAFGLVNIEALSMGSVLLGPSIGGVEEIIQEGKNGYFIDPHDPEDIFNKVDQILSDESLYKTLSHQAYQTFEAKYSMTDRNIKTIIHKIITFIS